jgi:hypothetical protein
MKKIDFKKELKHLYQPSTRKIEIVDIPRMDFLMVDGKGDQTPYKNLKMQLKCYSLFLIA